MEETLELAKTLGRVDQEDWARLELLCRAAEAELKHWLRPGDVVDVEIEGIGTLRNPLV